MDCEAKNLADQLDISKLPASRPGQISEIQGLEHSLNLQIADSFSCIYRIMNGFYNYHYASQMTLWSIDKIARFNKGSRIEKPGAYLHIGDVLMEADYIMMNVTQSAAEIRLLHEDRVLSSSLISFLIDMNSGKFDFL